MIIYFADRKINILGMASTSLPNGLRIYDDLTVEDVKTIGAINRIALNAYFMDSLLQEN